MKDGAFIVEVMDAEGATYKYVFKARSRRHVKREAREWVARSEWATTLIGIKPEAHYTSPATSRSLLAVAGVTLAVAGVTIFAMMIIGLSLEGAI